MKPRCRSQWITPAHSGALAPARNVHARVSSSPVVRNVRRPSRWYARPARPWRATLSPMPNISRISTRSSGAHAAISASMSMRHRERVGSERRRDRVGVGDLVLGDVHHDEVRLAREQEARREQRRSSAERSRPVDGRAVAEHRVRAFERRDLGQRSPCRPLDARRCRLSRCSTRREVGHHELELERRRDRLRDRARPPTVVERAQHERGSRRSCATRRGTFVPRPSPGFAPGGSAMCTSSKPAWHDLLRLRHRRRGGRAARREPARSPPPPRTRSGSGRPVRALNSRFEPAP